MKGCQGSYTFTSAELMDGFELFGDDVDYDTFGGIAINSKLLPGFLEK